MADLPAMKVARAVVEAHIENYGMVPHPDRLKEAIAELLTTGIFRGTIDGQSGYWSAPAMCRPRAKIRPRAMFRQQQTQEGRA
jgi:hypothetical protein